MTPEQLSQYNELYNNLLNGGELPPIENTAGGASTGMNNFFNTPQYQLAYGANANQVDPVERFRKDPGYQFSIDEGIKQLKNSYAAKGLGQSGALGREIEQFSQGTADQNYQRFLQQQMGLFGDYQNRLSGLSQFGAGQTGGAQADASSQMLAQLLGGYNMNIGQGLSGNIINTGQNLSSLYANQGIFNANALLNTAAARANSIFQGNVLGAQISANNAASNAGTANNSMAAQGYSNALGGGSIGPNNYTTRIGTGGLPGAVPQYY